MLNNTFNGPYHKEFYQKLKKAPEDSDAIITEFEEKKPYSYKKGTKANPRK